MSHLCSTTASYGQHHSADKGPEYPSCLYESSTLFLLCSSQWQHICFFFHMHVYTRTVLVRPGGRGMMHPIRHVGHYIRDSISLEKTTACWSLYLWLTPLGWKKHRWLALLFGTLMLSMSSFGLLPYHKGSAVTALHVLWLFCHIRVPTVVSILYWVIWKKYISCFADMLLYHQNTDTILFSYRSFEQIHPL